MEHDLTYEQKFVELIGGKIIESDEPNTWIVLDNDDNKIGTIKYKKIFSGNKKKNLCPVYAYCTEINTDKISFNHDRKINDVKGNITTLIPNLYSFEVKRENLSPIHVDLNLDPKYFDIKIWGQEYGFMNFNIDEYNGLYLSYPSKTEKFNIEETVKYKIDDEQSDYLYRIHYCPNNIPFTTDSGISREIEGIYSPLMHDEDELKVRESTWINKQIVSFRESLLDGTVEEMTIRHEMGINSLNYFRNLLKEILPFEEDIILKGISKELIEKTNTEVFFNTTQKQNIKTNN